MNLPHKIREAMSDEPEIVCFPGLFADSCSAPAAQRALSSTQRPHMVTIWTAEGMSPKAPGHIARAHLQVIALLQQLSANFLQPSNMPRSQLKYSIQVRLIYRLN